MTLRRDFAVPPGRHAGAPPERRGLARDGVRLLIARPGRIRHARFHDLPRHLRPGDIVVVNTSATLPAAVRGTVTGPGRHRTDVHIATQLPDGSWIIEVRSADRTGPDTSLAPGRVIVLPGPRRVTLASSFPEPGRPAARLWKARPAGGDALPDRVTYLSAHGRPITYGRLTGRFPLSDYQTTYATRPGSAELVSAGRPITERVLVRLISLGITVAPLVLHTGVSSPEAHEPPAPEEFDVPADTARLVNSARDAGRRVVAVGTTVARALESVTGADGVVRPGTGWTDLVLTAERPARVVTGLISGLHEPGASHLMLLESVAGPALVAEAYAAALAAAPDDGEPGGDIPYLWHEFGDSMLFLP
ncbi:MAG TPA: S-adenosylmethionine:tRNA ribosyltransferase-isomerase [Actinoplanes sp.]|nr:S-adenosylmethionine:tRNA ribosyltransferase-isomerase [Actinoplanes sp.]